MACWRFRLVAHVLRPMHWPTCSLHALSHSAVVRLKHYEHSFIRCISQPGSFNFGKLIRKRHGTNKNNLRMARSVLCQTTVADQAARHRTLSRHARARTSAPSERYRSAAEGPFFRLNQIVVKRRLRNFVDVAFTNFAKLKVLS